MRLFFRILLILSLVASGSFGAIAHPAVPDDLGVFHILMDFRHILGFSALGVFAGLYIQFFGGRFYVYATMVPFIIIEMYAHISLEGELGWQFALGFLSFGFFVALMASDLARRAVAKLKFSPRKRPEREFT